MRAEPLSTEPAPDNPLVVYLVVRKDLNMGVGKTAAQCGHAVHIFNMWYREMLKGQKGCNHLFYRYQLWESRKDNGGFTKIVLGAHDKEWLKLKELYDPITVTDAGNTEVPPGTETVMILPPMLRGERLPLLKKQRIL